MTYLVEVITERVHAISNVSKFIYDDLSDTFDFHDKDGHTLAVFPREKVVSITEH